MQLRIVIEHQGSEPVPQIKLVSHEGTLMLGPYIASSNSIPFQVVMSCYMLASNQVEDRLPLSETNRVVPKNE